MINCQDDDLCDNAQKPSVFGGVGLGLPLAKQFIELQGGTLSLDSVQNFGTTAYMVLPASRAIGESGNNAVTLPSLRTASEAPHAVAA